MNKILLICTFFFLSCVNTSAQWFIASQPTNSQLYSLYFIDSNTGFVGGNQGGSVLRTTDGGISFFITQSGSTSWWIDMFFINPSTGFASGQNGSIIKTTNQGQNWFVVNSSAPFMHVIRFPSINIGYAAGSSGILKTTNSGNNWNSLSNPFSAYLLGASFINDNTGYISGDNGLLAKTTNGGMQWVTIFSGSNDSNEEVVFTDSNTGYVTGKFGRILKTTDSGNTWLIQNSGTSAWLFDLFMLNSNTGWVCGENGTIISTINGGTNWVTQTSPSVSLLRQIHFINSNTGFAVADNGSILKTTNGGNPIGIEPISHEVPNSYSLFQNYPNPFNPVTQIEYSLLNSANVKITVFDLSGKSIQTLINEYEKLGTYRIHFDGSNLASGIYFYKIETKSFTNVKKMILLK